MLRKNFRLFRAMPYLFSFAMLMLLPPEAMGREEQDYLVGKVGQKEIYFSEIQRAVNRLDPHLRENFETGLPWRLDFIRNYLAQYALAERARREGLDRDPDIALELELSVRRALADRLVEQKVNEIRVSEADIEKFYQEDRSRYGVPTRVKLSFLAVEDQEKARETREKLAKGKSFEKAAKGKRSELKEWISEGAPFAPGLEGLTAEEWREVFQLEPGTTSRPLEKEGKTLFLHVEAREPGSERPFEEVREQVGQDYGRKVMDETIGQLVREALAEEGVEINETGIRSGFENPGGAEAA